ncbi:MAG: 2-amino-4-hydroxy-6-hydroxymethyldihydropteridine diphosphokinase [SAR202 cluster bacterium Io17-Chloro-G7]|nr:MAG: 2-amino-4-hydroxy-6-hydroxymethyldihydropteridine diphosphokinase [SAR202 cluster bacterium Io17-Chloro-G7]
MTGKWEKAYLGLGSNLGRREGNLAAAIQALNEAPANSISSDRDDCTPVATLIRVLRSSGIYETAPWGLEDQQDFLNSVIEVETLLTPAGLLERIKGVEHTLGRKPGVRYGPRLIDIDILLFGNQVVEQAELQIPHLRLHLRAFALIPLAELVPSLVHPVLNLTVGQLVRQVDCREGVRSWAPPPAVLGK